MLIFSRISDRENRNFNISSNNEYNSIITNNVLNSSIGENRVNLSNFTNNECVKYICDMVPIII